MKASVSAYDVKKGVLLPPCPAMPCCGFIIFPLPPCRLLLRFLTHEPNPGIWRSNGKEGKGGEDVFLALH
uniref:Uncharacterized protein n=1 Tax=Oryza brachyantha TaxID=4533 RepID=J3LU55_ORYBR